MQCEQIISMNQQGIDESLRWRRRILGGDKQLERSRAETSVTVGLGQTH